MDKPRLKDHMLAAGKKRLEQFRQKKQNKAASAKVSRPVNIDLEHASESKVENSSPGSEFFEHTETGHLVIEMDSKAGGSDKFGAGTPLKLRNDEPDVLGLPASSSSQEQKFGNQEALYSHPIHVQEFVPLAASQAATAPDVCSSVPLSGDGSASSSELNHSRPQDKARMQQGAAQSDHQELGLGDSVVCVELEAEPGSEHVYETYTEGLQPLQLAHMSGHDCLPDADKLTSNNVKDVMTKRQAHTNEFTKAILREQGIEEGNQEDQTSLSLEITVEDTIPGTDVNDASKEEGLLAEDLSDQRLLADSTLYNGQSQLTSDTDFLSHRISLMETEIANLNYVKHQVSSLEGEVAQLTVALRQSNDQLQVLNADKDGLAIERDSLSQILNSEYEQKVNLMTELEQLRKNSWDLNEEKELVTTKLSALQLEIKELHERNTQLQTELSTSQQQFVGSLGEVEALRDAMHELDVQLVTARENNLETERRLEETMQELLQATHENKSLAATLKANEEKVIQLGKREEKALKVNSQLEDSKKEIERRSEERVQELLQVTRQNEDLVSCLEMKEAQLTEVRARDEQMMKELEYVKSQVEANGIENASLVEQLEKVCQRMSDLESQREELLLLVREGNNKNDRLVEQLQEDEVRYGALINENSGLVVDLKRTKEELQNLHNQFTIASDTNTQKLRKVDEEKEDLEKDLHKVREELADLSDRNCQLLTELDGYTKLSGKLEVDNTELMLRLKGMQDEMGTLMAEKELQDAKLVVLEKEGSQSGERQAELVTEISNLRCKMQKCNEEKKLLVADLTHRADVAERSLENRLQAEQDLGILTAQLQTTVDESAKLQSELYEERKVVKCLEDQIAELSVQFQETNIQSQKLQDEKNKLASELIALKDQLADLQARHLQSEESVCFHSEVNERQNGQILVLDEQVKVHQRKELETLQHLVDMENQLSILTAENSNLRQELHTLHLQYDNLAQEEAALRHELGAANEHVNEVEASKFSLDLELTTLKKQLQITSEDRALLSNPPESLQPRELQAAVHVVDAEKCHQDLAGESVEACPEPGKQRSCLQVGSNVPAVGSFELSQEIEKREERTPSDLVIYPVHMQESENDRPVAELENVKLELMNLIEDNVRLSQKLNNSEHVKQMLHEENSQLKAALQLLQDPLRQKERENAPHSLDSDTSIQQLQEFTSVTVLNKLDSPTVHNFLPSSRQNTSMASGVSKLIKAFEAKATTRSTKGNDILIQVPQMQGQTGIPLHADVGFQLQQLTDSEDEKAYFVGALRQVEIDTSILQQHIIELEEKLALLAEENNHLKTRLREDALESELCQQKMCELQKKAAEQVSYWQGQVDHLQDELKQQALRVQGERSSYIKALDHAAEAKDKAVGNNSSDQSDACFDMTEVMQKIEDLKSVHEELESLCAEIGCKLITAQQDRDAAKMKLILIHKKLHCVSPETQLAEGEGCFLTEQSSYVENNETGRSEETDVSSVDINDLYQQCCNSIEGLQECLEQKMRLESVMMELEASSSMKEIEVDALASKLSALSHNYAIKCSQAAKNKEEQDAAVRVVLVVYKRLCHLSQQCRLEEVDQLTEHPIELEAKEASGVSQEVEICSMDVDFLFQECGSMIDELQQALEEKKQMKASITGLKDLLFTKETDIEGLTKMVAELSKNCDLMSTEAVKASEERIILKDHLEKVQRMYSEQEKSHMRLISYASALSDRLFAALTDIGNDCNLEVVDSSDAINRLDFYITTLLVSYETTCKKVNELSFGAASVLSDTPCIPSLEDMEKSKVLLVAKEVVVTQLQEHILHLTSELDKARLDRDNKDAELQQVEQKLLAVREKLSLAVTKGKGLVQQRDALKQLLSEKSAELELSASSYKQELQLKAAALHEAEIKLKVYAEAGERVEALESELSYIRNSANALRESFLQKDAILQKIEELLEDADLPDELQIREIIEKVEWLIEAYNQKHMAAVQSEGQYVQSQGLMGPSVGAGREQDEISGVETALQKQEIEELNRKYEDLLRKYRSIAEQSAMLEQSLLERNFTVQRWEEVLNSIDMPSAVRSREPEDRIEWLGRAVADGQALTIQLQREVQSSQSASDTLNCALKELQEQNHLLSADLAARDIEIKKLAMDLEDVTLKWKSICKPTFQENRPSDRELSEPEPATSQETQRKQEASEGMQSPDQNPGLEALTSSIQKMMEEVVQAVEISTMFSGTSVTTSLESSFKLVVEKCKSSILEAMELRNRLASISSDLSLAEKEREDHVLLEQQLQSLQEALVERDLDVGNLMMQIRQLTSETSSHEQEISRLSLQVSSLTDELAFVREELAKSQLEAIEAEQKLTSVREKLSMAVKKGKSVVQQRDSMRQSLDEKTAELHQIKQEYYAQSLAIDEAQQKVNYLTGAMEQVGRLESDLASSRDYATRLERSLQESNGTVQRFAAAIDKLSTFGAPRSRDPVDKIQWLSQDLVDAQKRAAVCEQDAKKSKNAAELLVLELEEVQGRLDTLTDELMHAEKNVSILMGEKKAAETAKAEAGLRLEHAMANVNSLLFELSDVKEAKAEFERENSSLRDVVTAQMDEIRGGQVKAEQQLKDLNDLQAKLHSLKEEQAGLLNVVANEIFRLRQDTRRVKAFAAKISREFSSLKDRSTEPALLDCSDLMENYTFNWQSEVSRGDMEQITKNIPGIKTHSSSSGKSRSEGWEQANPLGFLRNQCEEMKNELHLFGDFFQEFMASSFQDSSDVSQLLLETCNGIGSFSQIIESLQRDAGLAAEASRLEKSREFAQLEVDFKSMTERVKKSVDELEHFKIQFSRASGRQIPWSSTSSQSFIDKSENVQSEDLQKFGTALADRLLATIKDFSRSEELRESKVEEFLQLQEQLTLERMENERLCEDLRSQLRKAAAAIDTVDQQHMLDKLKIDELEKAHREFEANDALLKQELNSVRNLVSMRNQEEESLVQALDEAETKNEQLFAKVEELEVAMQQKQVAFQTLEASRSKALNKLSTTLNKLDDLRRLSEGLLVEVENLHSLLESRDMQISELREEISNIRNEAVSMQKVIDGKTDDLSQFHRRILDIVAGVDVRGWEMPSDAVFERAAVGTQELLDVLGKRMNSILQGTEGLRAQLSRKDALLQDTQKRHDELAGKVIFFQEVLQEKQAHIERLKAEKSFGIPDDILVASTEVEEMANRGKCVVHPSPVATHVRSVRKVSTLDHLELDVDTEANKSLVDLDDDDKGHAFKPLTSSRFVPRATRVLVDRMDGFWVAGERLLMRKPEARLGVILYWFALHIWLVVLLL